MLVIENDDVDVILSSKDWTKDEASRTKDVVHAMVDMTMLEGCGT